MNNQPLRIVLVRSPAARDRLVQTLGDGNRSKTAAAPLVAILAADHAFHEKFPRTFPHFPAARDMFAADNAMRARSAEMYATLQVAYFILSVRAAGLAAGPMTGYDADALNDAFFADGQHKVLAVANIGKPGKGAWGSPAAPGLRRGRQHGLTLPLPPGHKPGQTHCEAPICGPNVVSPHEGRWSA
jgi:3-hydroxypropanoate dehydrogenase